MKLNGWHRLWILLSAVYLILVTLYVIFKFPNAAEIPHQAEFYKKLSQKSAAMIERDIFDEIQPGFHPIIEMPNKHIIHFTVKVSEEDMNIASQEYWRVVEQKATEKRLHLLLYAFLFWAVPCIGLYALGWSINWVYKGFKQKRDAQQNIRGDGD